MSSEAGAPEPTDASDAAPLSRDDLAPGLLAAAIAVTPSGMAICDEADVVLVANAALARFLGVADAEQLFGRRLQAHLVRKDRRSSPDASARAFKHASGEVVWGRVVRTLFGEAGSNATQGTHALVQIDDVTDSRAV